MPKARAKVKIELNRAQAYQIVRAFGPFGPDTKIGKEIFAIVEDAICKFDEAQRKEERAAEDKKIGR